jgi:hypothetical protein
LRLNTKIERIGLFDGSREEVLTEAVLTQINEAAEFQKGKMKGLGNAIDDRESKVGKLDKALDEATAKGWAIVDMKRDWKVVFPGEK